MVALFGNKRQFATPSEIDLDLRVGDVRGDVAYRRRADIAYRANRGRSWRRRGSANPGDEARSFLRHAGFTQPVDDALVSRDRGRAVSARRAGPKSGDGKSWIEGQPRLSFGPRLKRAPETRQSSRQIEMTAWKVL